MNENETRTTMNHHHHHRRPQTQQQTRPSTIRIFGSAWEKGRPFFYAGNYVLGLGGQGYLQILFRI